MVFEVVDKAFAAGGVELGEDVVEEDDGGLAEVFINEIGFDEFEG